MFITPKNFTLKIIKIKVTTKYWQRATETFKTKIKRLLSCHDWQIQHKRQRTTWTLGNVSVKKSKKIEIYRNIPVHELNILLCRFFITMTKKDGCVNEPSTLSSFQRSVQRYLDIENSTVNIFLDSEFFNSREVLLTKKDSWWKGKSTTSRKSTTSSMGLACGPRR